MQRNQKYPLESFRKQTRLEIEKQYPSVEKLAKHIRALRRKKNLTQNFLAELAGIEYKHLQALESPKNTHSPTLRTLEKISSALGLEVWELLKPTCSKK